MKIGVLGAGQLGRMLALAGFPLGLQFRFFADSPEAPASHLGELRVGSYEDKKALARFADDLDLVTYEFENVPVSAVCFLAQRMPVFPSPKALEVSQDRLREKKFFQRLGISTPAFASVNTSAALKTALQKIGFPAVLKTQQLGYDGQGQCVLRNPEEIESAWCALKGRALIMEEFVPFERELSILVLRGRDGKIAYYPLIDNDHQDGILRRSLAPAPRLKADLQAQAEHYARRIAEELHYVGVLAVEFFELDGQLLANEMAPRVHNSGHWTIEGAETSQFENHLRAIAGLPLGSTHSRGYSAMVNLIGTLPDTEKILAVPGARLHLYGKAPRPGRKLGHVTVCASTSKILQSRLAKIQSIISRDNERI